MLNQKIGILGGGQLGKMLCQDASKMGIRLHILEKDDSFPAAAVCPDLTFGDFTNYDDVIHFGKDMDILTVEIETVNTDALTTLVKQGVKVYPQPHILNLIKDKGLQKDFYVDQGLPTSRHELMNNKSEVISALESGNWKIPFVQKSRKDGYDGQGVVVIKSTHDLDKLLDVPCLIEELVDIDKEIAVIVARSESGEIKSYPTVEMEFHPTANLVEFLFAPSRLSSDIQAKAQYLAESIVDKLSIVGLLAVELFLTKSGEILINEVAPRPHNSGHHTIEANITSQYEQHIRAITNLPLGSTQTLCPAVMVNILGEDGHKGIATYQNIDQCLAIEGAHFHLYGKRDTKPFRKMGHATIVDESLDKAIEKAKFVKDTLKVISES